MTDDGTDRLHDVAEYYSARLARYGASARGVDWNGAQSQQMRFEQLCRVIDTAEPFSIIDLGCGYGALYEYLNKRYGSFDYSGWDISGAMIDAAEKRNAPTDSIRFAIGAEPDHIADFVVASGIFNVRLEYDRDEWARHIDATIAVMDRCSRRGFAFNCLTAYSDRDKMRDDLHYADPCALFDTCKTRYSKNVALLHDYDLYEFTLLVRKRS